MLTHQRGLGCRQTAKPSSVSFPLWNQYSDCRCGKNFNVDPKISIFHVPTLKRSFERHNVLAVARSQVTPCGLSPCDNRLLIPEDDGSKSSQTWFNLNNFLLWASTVAIQPKITCRQRRPKTVGLRLALSCEGISQLAKPSDRFEV